MRRQDRPCHARQLELFRPETPNLEWRQLPEDVRGTVARLDGAHAVETAAAGGRQPDRRGARR